MILSSACQPWPSDRAANAAQERSSYTTSWDTILADPRAGSRKLVLVDVIAWQPEPLNRCVRIG